MPLICRGFLRKYGYIRHMPRKGHVTCTGETRARSFISRESKVDSLACWLYQKQLLVPIILSRPHRIPTMAALAHPQANVSRSISNFITSHLPAVPSIASRLPTSSSTASSSSRAVEDSVHEQYETPSRTFASLLAELFPPFLLAVPKSKTSHSRKSMRSANKGLKNKTSQ